MVCPTDRDLILYTSDVNQRMWLAAVGRGELGPLHRHDKREWITHESFLGATDQVIFARWPFALMAIGVADEQARVVADFNAWHASANADGSLIVSDTTCPDIGLRLIDPATGEHRPLCYPRSSNGGTQWAFHRAGRRRHRGGVHLRAAVGPPASVVPSGRHAGGVHFRSHRHQPGVRGRAIGNRAQSKGVKPIRR